eukprot:scaffold19579_cov52-Attheya_sp.AAC.2
MILTLTIAHVVMVKAGTTEVRGWASALLQVFVGVTIGSCNDRKLKAPTNDDSSVEFFSRLKRTCKRRGVREARRHCHAFSGSEDVSRAVVISPPLSLASYLLLANKISCPLGQLKYYRYPEKSYPEKSGTFLFSASIMACIIMAVYSKQACSKIMNEATTTSSSAHVATAIEMIVNCDRA